MNIVAALLCLGIHAGDLAGQSPIDTLALRAHTYFLSHDLLEGRATGSAGAHTAALYIVSQCRALGLQPVAGRYLHTFPLEEASVVPSTRLTVTHGASQAAFQYSRDFTPDMGTVSTLIGFRGSTIYVGGLRDVAAGSLRNVDVTGAVAVALGAANNLAAIDTLKARGAVGILHLVPDQRTYRLYRSSRGNTRLHHADSTVESSFLPKLPSVIAGPNLSYDLVAATPLARGEAMSPGPLGLDVEYELELHRRSFEAGNVTCLLPGSSNVAADTAIAYSAHYDHLGIGIPDEHGDSIYNGFSDNAAGVAMLLAIAKAMVSDTAHPMRHSALFLFFTGEERGLLGSDYYASHPAWALAKTRAVINLDAGAPAGIPTSWRLAGVDTAGIGTVALQIGSERGWQITTSPARANSDYYPFVREGVEALFLVPGPGHYEGLSTDSSNALRKRWDSYHRPGDEWHGDFPFLGLERYAEYAYLIGRAIDDRVAPQRP
ncbi:MAG: M28 family peptidase [Gemmatimonadales bacterium]